MAGYSLLLVKITPVGERFLLFDHFFCQRNTKRNKISVSDSSSEIVCELRAYSSWVINNNQKYSPTCVVFLLHRLSSPNM